jgi:MFS family permease
VLVGIAIAVVQAVLIQPLVPRYGEKVIAIVCLLGQALCALGIFFAPTLWLIYPITVVTSGLSGFMFPTLNTLNANRMLSHEQGVLMGVTTALSGLMSILGPLWAGAVYDLIMLGAPYWMGAVVFVLAGLMLTRRSLCAAQ